MFSYHIIFSLFFIVFYLFEVVFSFFIPFLFKEFSLIFFERIENLLETNSLSFPLPETVFFFFQHLKNVVLFPHGLWKDFWWEIHCHSNRFSSAGKMPFLSCCFHKFLTMMCLGIDFSEFIMFRFCSAS